MAVMPIAKQPLFYWMSFFIIYIRFSYGLSTILQTKVMSTKIIDEEYNYLWVIKLYMSQRIILVFQTSFGGSLNSQFKTEQLQIKLQIMRNNYQVNTSNKTVEKRNPQETSETSMLLKNKPGQYETNKQFYKSGQRVDLRRQESSKTFKTIDIGKRREREGKQYDGSSISKERKQSEESEQEDEQELIKQKLKQRIEKMQEKMIQNAQKQLLNANLRAFDSTGTENTRPILLESFEKEKRTQGQGQNEEQEKSQINKFKTPIFSIQNMNAAKKVSKYGKNSEVSEVRKILTSTITGRESRRQCQSEHSDHSNIFTISQQKNKDNSRLRMEKQMEEKLEKQIVQNISKKSKKDRKNREIVSPCSSKTNFYYLKKKNDNNSQRKGRNIKDQFEVTMSDLVKKHEKTSRIWLNDPFLESQRLPSQKNLKFSINLLQKQDNQRKGSLKSKKSLDNRSRSSSRKSAHFKNKSFHTQYLTGKQKEELYIGQKKENLENIRRKIALAKENKEKQTAKLKAAQEEKKKQSQTKSYKHIINSIQKMLKEHQKYKRQNYRSLDQKPIKFSYVKKGEKQIQSRDIKYMYTPHQAKELSKRTKGFSMVILSPLERQNMQICQKLMDIQVSPQLNRQKMKTDFDTHEKLLRNMQKQPLPKNSTLILMNPRRKSFLREVQRRRNKKQQA